MIIIKVKYTSGVCFSYYEYFAMDIFFMRCHKTSPEIVSLPFCSESLSTSLKSRF